MMIIVQSAPMRTLNSVQAWQQFRKQENSSRQSDRDGCQYLTSSSLSAATSTPKSKASPLRTPSRVCPYMTSSSSFHAFSRSSSSSSHQFCTASASALHCTSPTTLLNSSSVLPILTTEYLNILGSRPKVLRTACCVLALESKRTTK
jgi:hypothetical protein